MSDKRPSEIINAATAELRRKNQERAERRLGQPLTAEELVHLEKTALSYGHLVAEDALRLIEQLREMRGPSAMEMLDVVRQFVRDGMSGEDAVRYGETWLTHWEATA